MYPSACNLFSSRPINKIELPSGAQTSLEQLSILSLYEEASPTEGSFEMNIESADVQQMLYASGDNDAVLMIGYLDSEDLVTIINSESTATALVLMVLQSYDQKSTEWKKLVRKIQKNEYGSEPTMDCTYTTKKIRLY